MPSRKRITKNVVRLLAKDQTKARCQNDPREASAIASNQELLTGKYSVCAVIFEPVGLRTASQRSATPRFGKA
jgi:hypothetical protein